MGSMRIFFGLVFMFVAQAVVANDVIQATTEERPLRLVEESFESENVSLMVSGDSVVAIEASPCRECRSVRYLPTRDISVTWGKTIVEPERYTDVPDGPGVVFLDKSSGLVTRVFVRDLKRGGVK